MQQPAPLPVATGEVMVALLDPTSGRPIQSWSFSGQAEITIGRSPDCHVEMRDPYVSRLHAHLLLRDGQWTLVSLGRHGVVVGNRMISEQPVSGEIRFRLGMAGPTLEFRTTTVSVQQLATISFDPLPLLNLHLDERKLEDEVTRLADSDYFKNLQQRAKELRRQRDQPG